MLLVSGFKSNLDEHVYCNTIKQLSVLAVNLLMLQLYFTLSLDNLIYLRGVGRVITLLYYLSSCKQQKGTFLLLLFWTLLHTACC
jgi:hypothetical protein